MDAALGKSAQTDKNTKGGRKGGKQLAGESEGQAQFDESLKSDWGGIVDAGVDQDTLASLSEM